MSFYNTITTGITYHADEADHSVIARISEYPEHDDNEYFVNLRIIVSNEATGNERHSHEINIFVDDMEKVGAFHKSLGDALRKIKKEGAK